MRFKPGDLVAWECVCDITVERTIELGIIKKFTGMIFTYGYYCYINGYDY